MRSVARSLIGSVVLVVCGYAIGMLQGRDLVSREYTVASSLMRDSVAKLDTAYIRDTIVMRRAITEYVTHRVTDTIMRRDTVYVRRDLADSALAGCQSVVLSCEARVQALSQSLAIAESTIYAVRPTPARRKTSLTAIVSAAAVGALIATAVR